MRNVILGLFLLFLGSREIYGQGWRWVERYDGPTAGSEDSATSLFVDAFGNAYVTGKSPGSGSGNDYTTIKYSTDGDSLWVARYNGTGNGADEASALTVDVSGNVYVTGRSTGSGTGYDYATVKYNSGGGQQWFVRHNGTGGGTDEASAIAVDGSGNVYVTGRSLGTVTDYDFATIKYNGTGGQLWNTPYDGPDNLADEGRAIAVDPAGNVYVTGRSARTLTGWDFITIKYDTAGNEDWAARYDGPVGDDEAFALALDPSGNVYVTGSSRGTGTLDDFVTIKYNSSGVLQWISRFNGPGSGPDVPSAIVLDDFGNVYVTGRSFNGTNNDYGTVKYNALGVQVWVNLYNGPGDGADEARSLVVDGSENVYITGRSTGSGSGGDYCIIAYNGIGDEIFVRRYNGPVNLNDMSIGIALDPLENLYVTGTSAGSGTLNDYATLKYCRPDDAATLSLSNPPDTVFTGTPYAPEAWVANFGGCEMDTFWVIATIGSYRDTVPVTSLAPLDSFLVSFSNWDVPAGDSATYLLSVCTSITGDRDSTNDCKEKTIFAHEGQSPILLSAIASDNLIPVFGIDSDDQVLITFSEPTNKAVIDASNINTALSLSNFHTWTDSSGFIGGAVWNGAGDVLRITLSTNLGLPTIAVGDVISPDGVTITDPFGNPVTTPVQITGSFDPQPGVEEEGLDFRFPISDFRLFQNQPNPFLSSTMIRYEIPLTPFGKGGAEGGGFQVLVRLAIYDLTGRLVETLVDGPQMPGVYQLPISNHQLPGSGIYLYRLQISLTPFNKGGKGDFTATKKLILLR